MKCTRCGGKKWVSSPYTPNFYIDCPTCNGTGEVGEEPSSGLSDENFERIKKEFPYIHFIDEKDEDLQTKSSGGAKQISSQEESSSSTEGRAVKPMPEAEPTKNAPDGYGPSASENQASPTAQNQNISPPSGAGKTLGLIAFEAHEGHRTYWKSIEPARWDEHSQSLRDHWEFVAQAVAAAARGRLEHEKETLCLSLKLKDARIAELEKECFRNSTETWSDAAERYRLCTLKQDAEISALRASQKELAEALKQVRESIRSYSISEDEVRYQIDMIDEALRKYEEGK